jgi:hypothetical protein
MQMGFVAQRSGANLFAGWRSFNRPQPCVTKQPLLRYSHM